MDFPARFNYSRRMMNHGADLPQQDVTLEQRMARALAGDKVAYDIVLRSISAHLLKVLSRKVSPAERDDVVQEILASIHKARHTYDCSRPLMPWVMAIAHYRLQDHWRRYYGRAAGAMVDIDTMENYLFQDLTKGMDEHEDISRVIKMLPPQQQKILDLMYRQDKSVQEVADELKMSVSAVKVAAHRSYKVFRKYMMEQ
jgi:RNA polymerase sigma-70 factor, ECF subfamily